MAAVTLAVIHLKIIRLVKKFKFEELESTIVPIFPEISWNSIRSELVKNHKRFTSANAAELIKVVITNTRLRLTDLEDRLATLELIDVCWHSSHRLWYGYTLIDNKKPESHFTNRKLQENIKNYFEVMNMQVSVKVKLHNGITYVSMKEGGIRKKQKLMKSPSFFALFMGQNYFFSVQKNASQHFLNAILTSMGYKKAKRFKLTGRDLKSLSAICWKKKEGALNTEHVNKIPKYEDAIPDKMETGIDFSQQMARRKYAEKCLGDDCPTLELLVINAANISITHSDVSAELADENLRITWEFRSRNIAEYLTKLIERRILVTPLPNYISNIFTLGKNELTFRSIIHSTHTYKCFVLEQQRRSSLFTEAFGGHLSVHVHGSYKNCEILPHCSYSASKP